VLGAAACEEFGRCAGSAPWHAPSGQPHAGNRPLHGMRHRAHQDPRRGHRAARLHAGCFQGHRARARGCSLARAARNDHSRPETAESHCEGTPGPGLVGQVMVSKYSDHQPLYRQVQIYGRHGVTLSRSTLCGWVAEAAELVSPTGRLDAARFVAIACNLRTSPEPSPRPTLWARAG